MNLQTLYLSYHIYIMNKLIFKREYTESDLVDAYCFHFSGSSKGEVEGYTLDNLLFIEIINYNTKELVESFMYNNYDPKNFGILKNTPKDKLRLEAEKLLNRDYEYTLSASEVSLPIMIDKIICDGRGRLLLAHALGIE